MVAAPVSPFAGEKTMQGVAPPLAFAPSPVAFAVTSPLPFGSFVEPPAPPSAVGESTIRESLLTSPDGVGVDVAVSPESRQPASRGPARRPYASAISTNELLERAAAMGPSRMAWESIVQPSDPILDEKRQPHVAERRERFTRLVKIGLGVCLAVCVVALGVSTLSDDSGSSASSESTMSAKTVPAKAIVPIEPLDGTKHGKVVRRLAPTATAIARSKRR